MGLQERDDALDKKMEENPMDEAIATLVKDAAKRKRQILLIALSLFVDLLLTVGLAILAFQARDTAITASKSEASLVASCHTGNEFRATESALWNHIIEIQPTQTLTPEQQAQREKTIADFQKYLKTTFAPRDCTKIIEE